MEIQCSSFLLRPWRMDDTSSLCKHANNSKVAENLRDIFPFPYTIEDAEFFITSIASSKSNLIMAIAVNGSAVGAIGIYPQTGINQKNAELGYWLGEQYWGKGIETEAVNAIVYYTFHNLDVHRIYASVFDRNLASMRVLEKCGFTREAIHYKAVVKNNLVMDEYLYVKLYP